MEEQNRAVMTLQELGLTQLQAKCYMVLVQTEKEKVQTISRRANIDRSNAYQTIEQLQKRGLVEKIVGKPTFYQALPIEKAALILLNKQKKHYDKVKKNTLELVQEYKTKNELSHVGYTFKIVERRKETEIENVIEAHSDLKDCTDIMINEKAFQACILNLPNVHLECLRRGIKYRLITEKINPQLFDEKFRNIMQHKNFQLRYAPNFPKAEIVIQDKKKAVIILVPGLGLGKKPALFTDHEGCVDIIQDHFDKVWKTAIRIPSPIPTTPKQK